MKLEILAPCGSMESLSAAVRCGANAVYLGTKELNARRGADNFDFPQLRQAVEYCHARDVKVYLTLNTLVSDNEMSEAYSVVENAMECGVDAFIIQDLGLAKMIHECFPQAHLHASTQCSVMTPDGIEYLKSLGFSRAVVPREMSEAEIRDIREKTDIELEIFVHGALCMCVSGQCYLSAMLGSRSGNRGLCAQPCRLSFSADNSGSFDLSLKDLSLIKRIKEIESAGVISLKIEGRMKRPEYVAAAVTACRKAIDGSFTASDELTLRNVFSRSGFTDGYFTGRRNDMFGTRQKEDVTAATEVLSRLGHLYDNENPLIKVNLALVCREGEPLTLTAKTDRKEVTVSSQIPERAINKPLTEEVLQKRISKLGGTQYYAGEIKIVLDEGLIVAASEINALRRRAVEMLDEPDKVEFEKRKINAVMPTKKNSTPYFTASFSSASQIPENHPFRRIFLPINSDVDDFVKFGAGVEIPRGLFGMQDKLVQRLTELKSAGVTMALCSNLGAYKTAQRLGFDVYAGFGLNIFNSTTANMFKSPILSFELTLSQANMINAADTGIIVWGKLPLMLTRNCPVKNNIGCAECKKQGVLTDRKGYKFRVVCSDYPCVEILNPYPVYLGDRMSEIKTDFAHFCFTDESADEIYKLVNMYKNNEKFSGNYTRGLYYRGVK